MAKCCDDGLVSLIRREVEIAIEDRLGELGKRLDKLESEQQLYAHLHQQMLWLATHVYTNSDIDDHLDQMKSTLLERIDHVQETCDADCIASRKALQKLQHLTMSAFSTLPPPPQDPTQRMPRGFDHQVKRASGRHHTINILPSRSQMSFTPPLQSCKNNSTFIPPARAEIYCIPEQCNAVWEQMNQKKCEFEVKAPRDLELFGSSASFALDESILATDSSIKQAFATKLATRNTGLDMSEETL